MVALTCDIFFKCAPGGSSSSLGSGLPISARVLIVRPMSPPYLVVVVVVVEIVPSSDTTTPLNYAPPYGCRWAKRRDGQTDLRHSGKADVDLLQHSDGKNDQYRGHFSGAVFLASRSGSMMAGFAMIIDRGWTAK